MGHHPQLLRFLELIAILKQVYLWFAVSACALSSGMISIAALRDASLPEACEILLLVLDLVEPWPLRPEPADLIDVFEFLDTRLFLPLLTPGRIEPLDAPLDARPKENNGSAPDSRWGGVTFIHVGPSLTHCIRDDQ